MPGMTPDFGAAVTAGAAGQTLQPQAQPTAPDNPEVYDEQIRNAYQQLNTMLTQQYPEVDFAAKFKDLISDVENRPEEQPTNPAAAFAYALGSPDKAPAILHEKVQRIHQQHDKKESDLLKLKEDLLTNAIQQEVQKGNFKLALSQSEKLAEIQRLNKDRDAAAAMRDWKEKQKIKSTDAKALVRARVSAIADGFHLPEKMKLALVNHGMTLVQALLSKTNLFGDSVYDQETVTQMVDSIIPQLFEFAKNASEPQPVKPPVAPPPPPTKTETPLQKAIREQREAAAKTK